MQNSHLQTLDISTHIPVPGTGTTPVQPSQPNGISYKWLLSAILALAVGFGPLLFSSDVESKDLSAMKERVARIEQGDVWQQQQLSDIKEDLRRIEGKVDGKLDEIMRRLDRQNDRQRGRN